MLLNIVLSNVEKIKKQTITAVLQAVIFPVFDSGFAVPVTVNRRLPMHQFSDKFRKSIKPEDGSGGLLVERGFGPNCCNEMFQSTLHLGAVKNLPTSPLYCSYRYNRSPQSTQREKKDESVLTTSVQPLI